jgi:hypothetical protein
LGQTVAGFRCGTSRRKRRGSGRRGQATGLRSDDTSALRGLRDSAGSGAPWLCKGQTAVPENQKGPWNRSSTGQIGGWSSPRSLSQVPAFGALAFAGRRLPDATPHGMRGFRSHGGTALTVAGRGVSSEASSPGSVALCRERLAGQGADTLAMGFASAPLP